jgi:superfamily I DNA/RNA helicase
VNVGKFDVVFVDEAQDLNAAQIAMVLSAVKIDGRIIAVGDPAQSIYQFRGADSEAIPNFIARLKAKTLPLSVTYRCPKRIVKLAQEVVPDIECSENAEEGTVNDIQSVELLKSVKVGDFILSRTNAPLIKYCMALLKAGVPANIQGRDIGANLLYFIKKSKAKTINSFITYVNTWRDQEVQRLMSEKKDTTACVDKADCLLNLCEGTLTIKDLQEVIEKLFNDEDNYKKVILSTTHRAKGLERDRVFVLVNTYRYGPGVTGEEANLWYVAITRAKKELFLVRSPSKYNKFDNKKTEKPEPIDDAYYDDNESTLGTAFKLK